MSERWAVANGNASVAATWNGGTLPAVGDDVYANGFIVVVDISVTWLSVRTLAGVTALAGGEFQLNNGVMLTANVMAGDTICLTYAGTGTATIVGNVVAGAVANAFGVSNNSSGALVINGNVSGGTASSARGVNNASTGNVTINGNAIGGTIASAYGVNNSGTGTVVVNGYAIGSDTGFGAGASGTTGTTHIRAAKHGALGCAPTVGIVLFLAPATATIEVRNAALTTKTLTIIGGPTEHWAVSSGFASNPATWNGGVLPDINDDVYANGFTVTIDVNTTYGSVRTTAGVTAAAGGAFRISDGVTLTANVIAGTSNCIESVASAPFSATVVGSVTGGTTAVAFGVDNRGTGTVNVVGNVTGGQTFGIYGVRNVGSGTLNITGNVTAGPLANSYGALSTGGAINITGNVTGGPGAGTSNYGLSITGGTVTINGNVTGGAAGSNIGVNLTGGASIVVTINGTVTGGSNATAAGVTNNNGTMIINGNVLGGSLGIGANLTAAGTITINGDCIGGDGATAYGAQVGGSVTGQLTVNGAAVGSATGAGTPGVNAVGTTPVIISKAKYGPAGASPCRGLVLMYPLYKSTVEVRNAASATQLLKFPFLLNSGFPLSRLV